MQTRKSKEVKEVKELREISLPSNSNEVKLDYSVPLTEVNFDYTRLGKKSTEQKQASEHELLEYQKRVSRRDATLTPEEIRNIVSEANERRKALEQSIIQQKQEYEYNRSLELQNKRRKEKEEVETFFEQSSNRFTQKYCDPITQKKISEETGIDRIISSRHFSGTYSNRYAHRCVVCGYHNPESLSISKIYQHIFENKDSHMQFTLNEIDKAYNELLTTLKRKQAEADNPDLRQQKLSKDLEALKKLKGAKYR